MRTRVLRRWKPLALAATVIVGAGALAATSVGAPQSTDAITAARFAITIDGYEIASFSELSGITSQIEATEYWETTGDHVMVNKLPGKFKPPTITLKRGMTSGLELWAWHEAVRLGDIGKARKNCSLTMFNAEGSPVAKYWLSNAWPSRLDISGLKAGAAEVLAETVVLTAENIQRVRP